MFPERSGVRFLFDFQNRMTCYNRATYQNTTNPTKWERRAFRQPRSREARRIERACSFFQMERETVFRLTEAFRLTEKVLFGEAVSFPALGLPIQ